MVLAGLKNSFKNINCIKKLCVVCCLFFIACNGNKNQSNQVQTTPAAPQVVVPAVSSDSAYTFLVEQLSFGPRVPGSKAHHNCEKYITNKLKSYLPNVIVQHGNTKTFDGKLFPIKNIIAQHNPHLGNRIMLSAHWDTRPFADGDSVNKYQPFDGANDGASGVAVLIEVARQLSIHKPNVGIDIVLFDMEDYGQEQDDTRYPQQQNTWCLGSQYWAANPHVPNYKAQYGILLDMVGGKDAVFPKEGTGMQFAEQVVNRVWQVAQNMGYTNFTNQITNPTMDDHYYVNTIANIPCIDIVHYDVQRPGYPSYHHTHGDNISVIDKNTLGQVGQLMLQIIFNHGNA